ncbi:hypothetical protein, partial [Clostridium tyrobutyricum]|uniref:hypothetical protein n=1 Tax=Clostridium tyrobutyricum TaxID=1519 RepID=UPI003F5DE860|nr:hypothetical protein [Clostridium tyrobutyricum]MBV4444972.1 hypothetical protein [Clostridium tyrobutyricum]
QKFYIDTDGNLVMDGVQKITLNGKTIIENTYNAYGGLNNIYDTNGNLVMKLGVESGTGGNTGATLIGYNKSPDKPRFKLGIAKDGDFGALELLDTNGEVGAVLYGNGTGALREDEVLNPIATQIYVLQHMNSGGES